MPKRIRTGPRTFNRRALPKPIVNKPPTIDVGGLNRAYDWLAVEKVIGLRLALEWYAVNTPKLLFGKPLDVDRQKTYDRAVKSKALGDNNPNGFEREHAWTTALRLHDKVWHDHKLPTIEEAETRVTSGGITPWVESLKTVVTTLNSAFLTANVKFAPTIDAERDFYEDTLHVPLLELEAMVPQPPLKIAMNEAINVAKVLSIITVDAEDGSKAQSMDGGKFLTMLPVILDAVTAWAIAQNGHSLSRPIGRVPKVKAPKIGATTNTTGATGITRARLWNDGAIIHIVVAGNPFHGQMQARYALIQDGMTVGQYKTARRNAQLGAGCAPIKAGVNKGLLTVT